MKVSKKGHGANEQLARVLKTDARFSCTAYQYVTYR